MKKNKIILSLLLVVAFILSGCNSTNNSSSTNKPKYIFYFIGDGMGSSHKSLAEGYMQWKNKDESFVLNMNDMPIQANLATESLSNTITDSAAAGTALSTGEKTSVGIIGMDKTGKTKYTSILKALQADGMAVGLVTTVTVTHATPAAFGANIVDRNDEISIAKQYLDAEYDYLAGGGSRYFTDQENGGKREAGDSLIDDFDSKGYTIDSSLSDFENTDFTKTKKYLGIYEDKYLTDVITQENNKKTSPTLSEMVTGGIDVLSQDEDGFFMMVEGGYIDGAAHNNDAPTILHETLAFDNAVKVAMEFYEKYPEDTLILVTADHETGGLSLGYNSYSINYEALDAVKASFGTAMEPFIVKGDYDGLFAAIEKEWHVELSDQDKEDIKARIATFPIADLLTDMGLDPSQQEKYEGMRHMMGLGGYASAPVLSRKTKVAFATQAHTAEPVPLTAIGVGSQKLGECNDLSDVPKVLAELMKVSIGKQ